MNIRTYSDQRESLNWGATGPTQGLRSIGELTIREAAFRSMVRYLESCLPREGVGLISVVQTEMGIVGERFYAGRNIDASPTRYTMDPADVAAAFRQMEHHGSWLGAIVHSHPRTPPVPSRGDLDEAGVPGVLHLIVGFDPAIAVRAWQLLYDDLGVARQATEVGFAILPESQGWTSQKTSVLIAGN